MKKAIAVVVVLAILGVLGWQVYRKVQMKLKKTGQRRQSTAVPVELSPVEKMTVHDTGFFTGTLEAKSNFTMAPKVGGRLEKLMVNIGDKVKKGQELAMLDDDEYVQQVDQAQAEVLVAKARSAESASSLEVAKREYERVKALREKKIASESELDAAGANYNAAQAMLSVTDAQITQQNAALAGAKVRLSYTKISASWQDGGGDRVIGERFVDEGAMLKANDPIVTVLDINSVIAVINVIERDYSKVKIGQEASVTTDAYPGRSFAGRVVRMAPLLKEASRQARVEIEVPNTDMTLKPGLFVRVQIEFAVHEDATVVPASSLVNRNGQRGVFVADLTAKKAHFVLVQTGFAESDKVEIVKPELSGFVVTVGHHLLEDGSEIVVPGASARATTDEKVKAEAGAGNRAGVRP